LLFFKDCWDKDKANSSFRLYLTIDSVVNAENYGVFGQALII